MKTGSASPDLIACGRARKKEIGSSWRAAWKEPQRPYRGRPGSASFTWLIFSATSSKLPPAAACRARWNWYDASTGSPSNGGRIGGLVSGKVVAWTSGRTRRLMLRESAAQAGGGSGA